VVLHAHLGNHHGRLQGSDQVDWLYGPDDWLVEQLRLDKEGVVMDIKEKCKKVAMQLMHGDEPHVVRVAGKLMPILPTGFTAKVATEIERVTMEAIREERKSLAQYIRTLATDCWISDDHSASTSLEGVADIIEGENK